jgi:hypothetical protein
MFTIFYAKNYFERENTVMNIPRKKSKPAVTVLALIAILIVIGCLAAACQPTPKEAIVQNKGDDDLKNAIAQTAEPTEQISQTEQPAATATAEPKIIVRDVSSNASNTVTVDIDAEVINRQPQNIPVAKIVPSSYTQEEWLHMVDVFFGNKELYTSKMTKEDYDQYIVKLRYRLTNDEELLKSDYADAGGITDIADIRAHYQEHLEKVIEKREDAPDERQRTDYETAVNSGGGLDVLVKTREGFWGNVRSSFMTAFNDGDYYYRSRDWCMPEYISPDYSDTDFLEAKQKAINIVAEMGIDNYVFSDAYFQEDHAHTSDGMQWYGTKYFVFCFDAIIGNSAMDATKAFTVAPSLVDMSGKDGFEDVEAPHYDKMIPYDRLEVWVEGDKVVQFSHRYPIEVTQIINDNVDIAIDYTQAIELAKKFAYTAYIDPRGFNVQAKLDISRIELALIRIKEKDTRDDIVVPVWNFCGTYRFKHSDSEYVDPETDEDGWAVREGIKEFADVLITINALDGTIVNTARGY